MSLLVLSAKHVSWQPSFPEQSELFPNLFAKNHTRIKPEPEKLVSRTDFTSRFQFWVLSESLRVCRSLLFAAARSILEWFFLGEKYGYNEEIYQNLSRSGSYKSRYPPVYPVYNHSRGLLKPRNEDGSPISSGQLMLNEYRAQRELYLDHLYQNLTETGSHVSRHLPNYPSYNLSKSSAVKIGHVKPSILKRLPKTPEGVPQNPRQQYLVRPPCKSRYTMANFVVEPSLKKLASVLVGI